MLRVILKAKAEELLAEEQAGFRPGQSTVEQIFNSQVIIEEELVSEVRGEWLCFESALETVVLPWFCSTFCWLRSVCV